jgi:hypothetical protein
MAFLNGTTAITFAVARKASFSSPRDSASNIAEVWTVSLAIEFSVIWVGSLWRVWQTVVPQVS